MKYFNIKLGDLKFGEDNRNFTMDKNNNTISQSLVAIKGVSQTVADQIYELSKRKDEFNNFIELRDAIKNECKGIKKNQLESLIDIGYFSEYGSISYLKKSLELYDKYYQMKTYSKKGNKIDDVVRMFSNKETEKQFREIDNVGLINHLMNDELNYISIIEKALVEFRAFGEITIKDEDYSPTVCVVVDLDDKYKTKKAKFYNIRSGKVSEEIKIGEGFYNQSPFEIGSVIDMYSTATKPKKIQVEYKKTNKKGEIEIKKKWVPNPNGEMEIWCDGFSTYNEEELNNLIIEEYKYKTNLNN